MGTYKNFHMFTKVDKGIDDYLEHLEKHVGKITGCTNLPEGIFSLGDDLERKDIVKKFNSLDPLPERGEPFMIVYTEHDQFDFEFHSLDNKNNSVVELSSFGNYERSYDELFKSYMNFAREYGKTFYHGTSEIGDEDVHGEIEGLYVEPYSLVKDKGEMVRFKMEELGLPASKEELSLLRNEADSSLKNDSVYLLDAAYYENELPYSDELVSYVGNRGNDPAFVLRYKDFQGIYSNVAVAVFPGLKDSVDLGELKEKLTDDVEKPWFRGRLADLDSSFRMERILPGEFEDTIESLKKDLVGDLNFLCKKELFLREDVREAAVSGLTFTGLLKPHVDERHVWDMTFSDVAEDKTILWSCSRKHVDDNGNLIENVANSYSYTDAKNEIFRQFEADISKYGPYMTDEKRKEISDSFYESYYNDKEKRHPHYEMKGSYIDKDGSLKEFQIRAEVFGKRVLTKEAERKDPPDHSDGAVMEVVFEMPKRNKGRSHER